MLSNFRKEIIQPIYQGRGRDLNQELLNLEGENLTKDIKSLSSKFGLNFQIIIDDIKNCLESNSYQDIQKQFIKDSQKYSEYYNQTKDEYFLFAQEVFSTMSDYINKLIFQTKRKLTKTLLQNPGIEDQKSNIAKILGKISEYSNSSLEDVNSDNQPIITKLDSQKDFLQDIVNILYSQQSQEKQIQSIRDSFLKNYNMKNRSLKKLYRELGLQEDYLHYIKEIDLNLIGLLLKIILATGDSNKNLFDNISGLDTLYQSLEDMIQKYLPPEKRKIAKKGPKILGKIDLPDDNRDRFAKKITDTKKQEIIQAPTTDPLDLVGKNMSQIKFLSAFSIGYVDIAEYIQSRQPIPARYFKSTKVEGYGTLHFFTIGVEQKGINQTFINVSVLDGDKVFNEGEIYEIMLTDKKRNEKSSNTDNKQSFHVQGILRSDLEKFNKPSTQTLGDQHPELKKLKDTMK